MSPSHVAANPRWSLLIPPVALVLLIATWGRELGWLPVVLVSIGLAAAVLTAVHHAEIVALRVGEPFGTLILAVAVTVIEVALIVTLMISGGDNAASLARDTVFAAIMITTGGVVGLSLVVGSYHHGVQRFRTEGSTGALAATRSGRRFAARGAYRRSASPRSGWRVRSSWASRRRRWRCWR